MVRAGRRVLASTGKLDVHACICWHVAFNKSQDAGKRPQELLDLERAEWAKERQHLQAALRTAQGDVAELTQDVEELRQVVANLELAPTARRCIRGSSEYPRRSGREGFRPDTQYAGYIGITQDAHYRYAVDVDGYPLYIAVGAPEDVDGDAYDPGAEFLVNGQLTCKTLQFGVFKVMDCWQPAKLAHIETRSVRDWL